MKCSIPHVTDHPLLIQQLQSFSNLTKRHLLKERQLSLLNRQSIIRKKNVLAVAFPRTCFANSLWLGAFPPTLNRPPPPLFSSPNANLAALFILLTTSHNASASAFIDFVLGAEKVAFKYVVCTNKSIDHFLHFELPLPSICDGDLNLFVHDGRCAYLCVVQHYFFQMNHTNDTFDESVDTLVDILYCKLWGDLMDLMHCWDVVWALGTADFVRA